MRELPLYPSSPKTCLGYVLAKSSGVCDDDHGTAVVLKRFVFSDPSINRVMLVFRLGVCGGKGEFTKCRLKAHLLNHQ